LPTDRVAPVNRGESTVTPQPPPQIPQKPRQDTQQAAVKPKPQPKPNPIQEFWTEFLQEPAPVSLFVGVYLVTGAVLRLSQAPVIIWLWVGVGFMFMAWIGVLAMARTVAVAVAGAAVEAGVMTVAVGEVMTLAGALAWLFAWYVATIPVVDWQYIKYKACWQVEIILSILASLGLVLGTLLSLLFDFNIPADWTWLPTRLR